MDFKAYSLDSNHYDATSVLGLALLRMKDYHEALAAFIISHQIDPQNIDALTM
ncbi:hypothetical protein [Paenibacillus macerans]|uniref:hypothetical protein n=1 Tax=Paenibacillus macerans TaxID=44252 RepID=UPI003D312B97